MRRNIVGVLALALLAVQAYAKVVPIIHCWEDDVRVGFAGSQAIYIGATNDKAELQEIPTGNHNYLSDSLVPPMMYWSGFNGFMHAYSQNPPWTLDWHLNDGSDTYEVQMSTQATQKQCDPNAVLSLTFNFQAVPAAFAALDKTRSGTNIEFILFDKFNFPYAAMGDFAWTATADGFMGTLNLHRGANGESQYMLAALVAAKTGDRAMGEITHMIDNALYVPGVTNCCSLTHVAANGTMTDVLGTPVPPPAPIGTMPTPPISLPPTSLPPLPLIPTADCYERNGTDIWFYYGVNNTNPGAVHVPVGGYNLIQTLPDQRSLSTPDTFVPGFSAFVAAIPVPTPANQAASSQWVLLNHYVMLIGTGANQECKTAQDQRVMIYFNGALPTTIADLVQQLETIVASYIPGMPYTPGGSSNTISIITSQDSPTSWHMEITLNRGPVSQYRGAAYLYSAFYNSATANEFSTRLETLTNTAPTRLSANPTSVEKYGVQRASPTNPINPINPPTNPPQHKKLSGGAIFGIIVAVFAGLGLIGAVIWYMRRKSDSSSQAQGGFEKLIQ